MRAGRSTWNIYGNDDETDTPIAVKAVRLYTHFSEENVACVAFYDQAFMSALTEETNEMGLQTQDFIKSAKSLQEQASKQPKGTEQILELNIDTRLVKNARVEASARGNVWYSDEPKDRGGDGSAPGPLAYFLSAVGLGIITQCSYEAAVRGVEIDEIGVAVKAPLRRAPGSSFETISYETRMKGKISADTAEEIVRTAVRKSFITNTLKKGVKVTGKIILNDQPLPAVID